MSYGFHIVTGEQSLNPVFEFSYCDGETLSTVQDTYRGNVYTVPQGLFAQPSPKCSFSVDSKFFSSSVKMANSYQQDSCKLLLLHRYIRPYTHIVVLQQLKPVSVEEALFGECLPVHPLLIPKRNQCQQLESKRKKLLVPL